MDTPIKTIEELRKEKEVLKGERIQLLKDVATSDTIIINEKKVAEDLLSKKNKATSIEKDASKEKRQEEPDGNIESERQEFLKKILEYREKEKLYNEEKIRLNNLLQTLNAELKLSQEKDEEDYLASLKKGEIPPTPENLSDVDKIIEETPTAEKKEIEEEAEIPSNPEILSNVDKIIEEIPDKDKEIIKNEMRKDTPLEFESQKVKTDYKVYIINNIAKLFSGFKISPRIKSIIERNARKMLITTAVLTVWTSNSSYIIPDRVRVDVNPLKNKDILDTTNRNKKLSILDIATYDKLPESAKNIYLYASEKSKDSYIIVDKPTATLFIIGEDGKLVAQMPVILGQTKGETPNKADPDSDVAVEATTPAGKYRIGRLGVNEKDEVFYEGKMITIYGSGGLAIHMTYPLEIEKRTEALDTSTPDDNRLSWGCINVDKKMWKFLEINVKNRGTCLYITPDNPMASLNPETGKVENVINQYLLAMNNINN